MKIWIVEGCTGIYEDRRKWQIAAYFDWRKARSHCIKAQKYCDQNRIKYDDDWDFVKVKNPYDKFMQYDGEIEYCYHGIEIADELPQSYTGYTK